MPFLRNPYSVLYNLSCPAPTSPLANHTLANQSRLLAYPHSELDSALCTLTLIYLSTFAQELCSDFHLCIH